ncbi:MAG: hypothetical protein RIS70_3571 [Planctomycetota bacterium]
MLVLSRKESERIRLGNSIVVTVVRVSGDKVRLGIEAPPDVLVLREELEAHNETVGVSGTDTGVEKAVSSRSAAGDGVAAGRFQEVEIRLSDLEALRGPIQGRALAS